MRAADKLRDLKKTDGLHRPFSLSGRRCYLVGNQSGLFPDIGWHTYNEMGGVWTHPIKIADGFWIGIDLPDEDREGYNPMRRAWLRECNEFVLGEGGAWVEHHYHDMRCQTNYSILPRVSVVRREFIPHQEPALCIEVEVTSTDETLKDIQLNFLTRFDILPVWDSGWPDPVHLEVETEGNDLVVVHGVTNFDLPFGVGCWSAAMVTDTPARRIAIGDDIWGHERTTGHGMSVLMKTPLTLEPTRRVRFVMAGDHTGQQGAIDCARRVLADWEGDYEEKVRWYHHIADEMTDVDTPDDLLNEGYLWGKMNLEWLTHTSPILGTGTYAGLQDYTQYFGGDTEVSIPGLLNAGFHDTAIEALRMIGDKAAQAGGRVPHAFVSNGHVYDPGQFGETPLLPKYAWMTYLWTGDEDFLSHMYPICKKGMFDYVLNATRKDGVILQDYEDKPDSQLGRGNPNDIAVGFKEFAKMAEHMGDTEQAEKSRALSKDFLKQVEEMFWVDDPGMYVGMLDDDNNPMISPRMKDTGEIDEGTTVVMAWAGLVDAARVNHVFDWIDKPVYWCDYGIGYKVAQGALMPYGTNKAAVGAFNYGRQEQGLRLLRCTARCTGHIMPGAIPETIMGDGDPEKFNIYESSHWEFLQLWSAALYVEGLIWGLIRVEPDAARGKLTLTPRLPEGWPHAEVKNLKIGKSRINVRIDKDGAKVTHVDGPKLDVELK